MRGEVGEQRRLVERLLPIEAQGEPVEWEVELRQLVQVRPPAQVVKVEPAQPSEAWFVEHAAKHQGVGELVERELVEGKRIDILEEVVHGRLRRLDRPEEGASLAESHGIDVRLEHVDDLDE